jgi:predicted outer membrane repeat protein
LWVYILGHGTVQNVTFEGNSTSAAFNEVGQGGAMVVTLGEIDITNVTFANNHASYQGGALHGGGGSSDRIVTLTNTIFYNNTLNYGQTIPSDTRWQGYHTNRPMQDGGGNIQHPQFKPIYDNDVNNWITANPIFADPLLSVLMDNTGPNETMALGDGSPAINAGVGGCPTTDQRGKSRYFACDIGAFEFLPYMTLLPSTAIIGAGESAAFQVGIETGVPVADTFTLGFTDNYPDLDVSLSPGTIAGSQTATLTLTDTHSGPIPGEWYHVPLTATGVDRIVSGKAYLLVEGNGIYLPFVMR